ncbi:hypothetical protein DL766_008527 [Monosporascus sp. MC13-8B]|uniref:HNH nuclease domain-containing protein n=1 Tax=Monosporascus cannonballus TaxID=155416 RepID=A0ABY0H478_9PEZI|nr:hypothetical protein DL762_005663 [Monosporascus cannonballus]RYO87062.1 hypothetical protein DL763_006505 [Monosporascus cannonballus]RYP19103.1 hypothetical protein DL766_008527 [Monosporascus sp. MC13-8B]
MATPYHHHQSSLENIFDLSAKPSLETDQRIKATNKFYSIVKHFVTAEKNSNRSHYKRSQLIHYTHEYALSQESKDSFLLAFFEAMGLSIDKDGDSDFEHIESTFFDFADYLLDNFFLPLKASGAKTPQPSPAVHSAVQRVQGGGETQGYIGTPDRVSDLRAQCLARDRHRCVVSRKFDQIEAATRFERDGDDARDDDGTLLTEDSMAFDILEVAHILPHSLTKVNVGGQLDPSKEAALAVLNMFDHGIAHLIKGTDIDRPRNAITLTHSLHRFFGDFKIFFEPLQDQPHTYWIRSFLPPYVFRDPPLPITRTLYLTESRTIDTPWPRLLAVHRAIAHILHLSAAGEYIDKLLRDADKDGGDIREDGSTDLGRLARLAMGGLSIAG